MKQQIVIIHGGTIFDTYEEYISYLKNKEVNFEKLKNPGGWKGALAKELRNNFEVFLPRMPNAANARYREWKIWFEKIIRLLGDNLILIGHSLGGIFLAKYLAENVLSKTIKATILIAAPFDDSGDGESVTDFKLPPSLSRFSEQGGKIYLIHSKDDPLVSFDQLKKYKQAISNAETMIFDNKEHFNQRTFPELVGLINKI